MKKITSEIRARLVEVGGRTSQDLGLGRIVGQILVYLYLRNGDCSLDQIGEDLGLSKASVSVAVRQLESLGLLRRAWKKGDRKGYYRTADDIGTALQNGLFAFIRQKMQAVGTELDYVNEMIEKADASSNTDPDTQFLYNRIKRAKLLHDQVGQTLESPLMKVFLKA
ncbi:MAG: MarR family transcriptional regulator [Candidatus Aminicenantes bacterium]|nr:MarR family transcriptional regulator [Candidatus Aminicenantes bacterium]